MVKLILTFIMSLALVSCGAGGLKYSRVSDFGSFLSADVTKSGKKVMWFQVFDQVEKPDSIKSYEQAKDKVATYPAKKNQGKWIWILVGNRFEIRLVADSKSKLYQDEKKLEEFINTFDLAGLAGVSQTTKLTAKQMRKYIPNLPEVKKKSNSKSKKSLFKKKTDKSDK